MIKRALIVKDPWATQIVKGIKKMEYRSRPTNIRERVGIIKAGSSLVIGEVDIIDCVHKWVADFITDDEFAWILANPYEYGIPKHYDHPPGAQIWVRLDRVESEWFKSVSATHHPCWTPEYSTE